MRALVVYESMFGNTQRIAEAIGKGLSPELDVEVVEVGSAPGSTEGFDLVLIGGPTHAFTMSTRQSRTTTAEKAGGDVVSKGPGIRDWIDSVAPHQDRTPFAAFDTRYDKTPWLTGSAARRAASRMRRRGFEPLSAAMSFFVEHEKGPLADGEIDRAFEWGERLAVRIVMAG